jgi:hypothetical protein
VAHGHEGASVRLLGLGIGGPSLGDTVYKLTIYIELMLGYFVTGDSTYGRLRYA